MNQNTVIACLILIFGINYNLGLEYNKQNRYYNTNSDFLLHEGGNYANSLKKDPVASQSTASSSQSQQSANNGKSDYGAQFPALGKPSTPKTPTAGTTANQNSGRRDYVASFPSLPTVSTPQPSSPSRPTSTNAWNVQRPQSPSSGNGKRDYVAPNFTTQKPTSPNSGKVQDLINYFDKNDNSQNVPQNAPSYSNILQGTTGTTHKVNPGLTLTTSSFMPTPKPSTPTKPLSFSSVVSGNKSPSPNSPNSPAPSSKPTTKFPTSGPTSRPPLPSSIANNNANIQYSSGSPTDTEIQTLSEELLRKDTNNAAKYVTINYQEKTSAQSKDDKAPMPLLTVSPQVWNIPTVQAFVPLLDNYERDTLVNEYVTPQEKNEENVFMDAVMSTTVIRHLMNYLKAKGLVSPDPRHQRDFLKQLWFNLYSRGRGKIGSSGFEHVFVSELKNGQVSGLHNWIYFAKEESANRVNYLGFLKHVDLNDKGAVLKLHFNQQGADKPVDSLFIGTSPELEMALYTLCFLTRPDTECKLKLASKDIEIVTHKFRYRSKDYIGSAYPQIPVNWN